MLDPSAKKKIITKKKKKRITEDSFEGSLVKAFWHVHWNGPVEIAATVNKELTNLRVS